MLASLRDPVLLVHDPVVFAALDHRLMAFNSFGGNSKVSAIGRAPPAEDVSASGLRDRRLMCYIQLMQLELNLVGSGSTLDFAMNDVTNILARIEIGRSYRW
jgi:hypothetical protein